MSQKKILSQVAFILFLSSILGIGINFSLFKRYFRGEFRQGFFPFEKGFSVTFISLSEAIELFSKRETYFIDSRPEKVFLEGHISGAFNLPYSANLGEDVLTHLSFSIKDTLVIYCDGSECQSSVALAKLLHQYGYQNIKVFFGGWREWMEAGLPVYSEDDSK